MGLLDGGLQIIFGNVFAPFFLDGTLYSVASLDDGEGGREVNSTPHAIKGMKDQWSESYDTILGGPRTDAVILVLQLGVAAFPKRTDMLELQELRSGVATMNWWEVVRVQQDPASAHWIIAAKQAAPPSQAGENS